MAAKTLPPPEVVRQIIEYQPDTGRLFWLERPQHLFQSSASRSQWHAARVWNATYAGKEAFTAMNSEGYLTGSVMRRSERAHRVAWAFMTGAWPCDEIDHINGNRADNRWLNLREVPPHINRRNMKQYASNRSGVVGVQKRGNRFYASMNINGRTHYLGCFTTIDQAAAARQAMMNRNHFHENHGRVSMDIDPESSAG